MKKISILLIILFVIPFNVFAVNVDDVNIPDTYLLKNEKLILNGYGYRKKFFFKIYIGALYLENKANKIDDVLNMQEKAIKMHFLYKKVEAEKLRDAFVEGFEDNGVKNSKEKFSDFLNAFNFDVKTGDELDLTIYQNTVSIIFNNKEIASFENKELADGIIKIYLGDEPADSSLKKGMLGL